MYELRISFLALLRLLSKCLWQPVYKLFNSLWEKRLQLFLTVGVMHKRMLFEILSNTWTDCVWLSLHILITCNNFVIIIKDTILYTLVFISKRAFLDLRAVHVIFIRNATQWPMFAANALNYHNISLFKLPYISFIVICGFYKCISCPDLRMLFFFVFTYQ